MRSMTANEAKKHFGKLLDTARREPVSVLKHGRPVTVMLSVEDYEELEQVKRGSLNADLRTGLNQLNNGEGIEVDGVGLGDLMDTVKAEGRKRLEKSVAD